MNCSEYCPIECNSFEFVFSTYAEKLFKSSVNITAKQRNKRVSTHIFHIGIWVYCKIARIFTKS